jgi:cysteine-rich repeat protein
MTARLPGQAVREPRRLWQWHFSHRTKPAMTAILWAATAVPRTAKAWSRAGNAGFLANRAHPSAATASSPAASVRPRQQRRRHGCSATVQDRTRLQVHRQPQRVLAHRLRRRQTRRRRGLRRRQHHALRWLLGGLPNRARLQRLVSCTSKCGDGIVLNEACDDGNAASGDGCSSNCTVEAGWTCTQPALGDKMLVPVIYRDFRFHNPSDFEPDVTGCRRSLSVGMVADRSGQGQEARLHGPYRPRRLIESRRAFAEWYRTTPNGVNHPTSAKMALWKNSKLAAT